MLEAEDLKTSNSISPYGGSLINLEVGDEAKPDLIAYANQLPSIQLTERNVCDLELLANGAFSPLDRFMDRADYERVLAEMRLANGSIFPIPITLSVDADQIRLFHPGDLANLTKFKWGRSIARLAK